MTIGQSLLVSVFGMAVVFAVLVALCLLISLFSKIVTAFGKKKAEAPQAAAVQAAPAASQDTGFTGGQLKLYDVDEKTAAIIMAIVSHESQIPLSELQFKSIKALD